MEWQAIITFLGTALLALLGYLVTYLNNLRLAQRAARLERINRQLREFYGPLFALTRASTMAWVAFRRRYRPGSSFWGGDEPPTSQQAVMWRLWITEVFMPRNLEMVRIITDKADLLEEAEMPECLLTLCAHVAGYIPVIKAWEDGDFSRHTSVVNFPSDALLEYTQERYLALKQEQARLLGRRAPRFEPQELEHPMIDEHESGITPRLGQLALEVAGDSSLFRLGPKMEDEAAMLTLFEQVTTPEGRSALSDETGISERALLAWAFRVDLLRIEGIEDYIDLLDRAGTDTVRELARRKPENLHERLLEINAAHQVVEHAPSLEQVRGWIEQAKTLPVTVRYS